MNARKLWSRTLIMVVVSLFLGFTALVVSFGAGSAFEHSKGEIIAPCVAAALYLAFLPILGRTEREPRVWAKLPRWLPPLPRCWASTGPEGFWHSLAGFRLPWQRDRSNDRTEGHSNTTRGTPTADSSNRGRSCRNNLLASFILLVAVALLIPIGVIPSVLADTSPRINAGRWVGFWHHSAV